MVSEAKAPAWSDHTHGTAWGVRAHTSTLTQSPPPYTVRWPLTPRVTRCLESLGCTTYHRLAPLHVSCQSWSFEHKTCGVSQCSHTLALQSVATCRCVKSVWESILTVETGRQRFIEWNNGSRTKVIALNLNIRGTDLNVFYPRPSCSTVCLHWVVLAESTYM